MMSNDRSRLMVCCEGQKGFWVRIGSFCAHDDGEGGTLLLDELPMGGRVVLCTPKADE